MLACWLLAKRNKGKKAKEVDDVNLFIYSFTLTNSLFAIRSLLVSCSSPARLLLVRHFFAVHNLKNASVLRLLDAKGDGGAGGM